MGFNQDHKFKKKHKMQEFDMQLHMIYAYEETEEEPLSLNVLGVDTNQASIEEHIEELAKEFADIFTEPKGLPPLRPNHNH